MADRDDPTYPTSRSRRQFLQQAGAAGLAGMAVPLLGSTAASAAARTARSRVRKAATPIKHIIVCCQENHAFDHYFGSYSGLPKGFGIPPGYTNPNGHGGTVKPFHFTDLTDGGQDPNHDWTSTHSCWDHGKMDGFYTTNGKAALGYYNASDLPYYYSLFPKYTLCANYSCGVLSETYPNRLVLYSGTSGGITTNGVNQNGSLNYPCVLDLLSGNGITFKNYNFHCPANYSILALFKKWATGGPNNELNQSMSKFFSDCTNNTLPQVSFITEAPLRRAPDGQHPHRREHDQVDRHRGAEVAGLGEHRDPDHLRRGRRLFRPPRPDPARRVRPGHPRADDYRLALRQARSCGHDLLRPQLGAEVHRGGVRPADAGLDEPPVRQEHAQGLQLRGERGAVPVPGRELRPQ